MGHLINPISNRISINSFWNSNWALVNNFNYTNVFKKDYILFQFLNWFSKKSKFGKFNIIISHYKIFRLYKTVYINFYYYNAGLEEKKYKYQVSFLKNFLKKRKYKLFSLKKDERAKKLNVFLRNYLIKKQTLKKQKSYTTVKKILVRKKIFKNTVSTKKIKSLYMYIIKIVISNIYWYLIQNSLKFFLSKLIVYKHTYFFNIYSLNFLNVTSDIISTYISLKLQQKYSLNWVLRPILKDLTSKVKKNIFLGYKIVCSGRFTRKQIATYMWMKQGSLRLNNFSNLVKYSESKVRLKYGLCGIKVWINYGSNDLKVLNRNLTLVYPMYTPFKYTLNFNTKTIDLHINYWFYAYLKVSFIKSKFFNFYKIFLNIKVKILIKYLVKKLFKNILNNYFQINQLSNNRLVLKLSNLNFKNINKVDLQVKRFVFLNYAKNKIKFKQL